MRARAFILDVPRHHTGDVAGDVGVSVDMNDGVNFDPSVLAAKLPPQAQSGAKNTYEAIKDGDYWKATDATAQATLGYLATFFPYGTIAAAVGEAILKAFEAGAPPATGLNPADTTWEQYWGSYDPGQPGTFTQYANAYIRGTWDGVKGGAGTLNDLYAAMAASLAVAIQTWNASHSPSSTYHYVVGPIGVAKNPNYPGFLSPGSVDPIGVAAFAASWKAGAPMGGGFKFIVNSGPERATGISSGLLGAISAEPPKTIYTFAAQDHISPTKPSLFPYVPAAIGIGAALFFANPLLGVAGVLTSVLWKAVKP